MRLFTQVKLLKDQKHLKISIQILFSIIQMTIIFGRNTIRVNLLQLQKPTYEKWEYSFKLISKRSFSKHLGMYCDKLKESKIRPVVTVLNVEEFDETLNQKCVTEQLLSPFQVISYQTFTYNFSLRHGEKLELFHKWQFKTSLEGNYTDFTYREI